MKDITAVLQTGVIMYIMASKVFFTFRPYQEGGKRSIFAVNTVALVTQQAEYISRHTGLSCKGYSGDMMVDFWQEQQWLTEIEEHQVLISNIDNFNFVLE